MADARDQANSRTLARELALKLLYVADLSKPEQQEEQLRDVLDVEQPSAAVSDLATEMASGVREARRELDDTIQDVALNWQVSRMPVIDRAILRMGAYELLYMHDVPPKVTINEAVELAKKYSTEKSGAFVNGVLDKIFQTRCPEKV
ncbi:MAG: transcription antitermination factor NusB [Planctomycetes bacterium]|nr:transcription antitermination factor NusB [Planctomycetota bacterium]MCB9934146.1 transcription antitermination factor NusB [Planctomycetota bacterium]